MINLFLTASNSDLTNLEPQQVNVEQQAEVPATPEQTSDSPAVSEINTADVTVPVIPALDLAPVQEDVASSSPAAEDVKADAPVVDAPAVEEVKLDAPVVDAPAVEEVNADAPVVDAPAVEEVNADAPVVDAPAVEEVKLDTTVVDAPAVEDTKSDASSDKSADDAASEEGSTPPVSPILAAAEGEQDVPAFNTDQIEPAFDANALLKQASEQVSSLNSTLKALGAGEGAVVDGVKASCGYIIGNEEEVVELYERLADVLNVDPAIRAFSRAWGQIEAQTNETLKNDAELNAMADKIDANNNAAQAILDAGLKTEDSANAIEAAARGKADVARAVAHLRDFSGQNYESAFVQAVAELSAKMSDRSVDLVWKRSTAAELLALLAGK